MIATAYLRSGFLLLFLAGLFFLTSCGQDAVDFEVVIGDNQTLESKMVPAPDNPEVEMESYEVASGVRINVKDATDVSPGSLKQRQWIVDGEKDSRDISTFNIILYETGQHLVELCHIYEEGVPHCTSKIFEVKGDGPVYNPDEGIPGLTEPESEPQEEEIAAEEEPLEEEPPLRGTKPDGRVIDAATAVSMRDGTGERDREAQAQREREAEAQREREAQAQREREAEAQREREAEAQRRADAAAREAEEQRRVAEARTTRERQEAEEAARIAREQREAEEADRLTRQREADRLARQKREAEEAERLAREKREAEAEAARQAEADRKAQESNTIAPPAPVEPAFRPRDSRNTIGALKEIFSESCGQFQAGPRQIKLEVRETIDLIGFTVHSDGCGTLRIGMKGSGMNESVTKPLSGGEETLVLSQLNWQLEAGQTYTMTLTPQKAATGCNLSAAPKLGDAGSCPGSSKRSSQVVLDQNGGQFVYELRYYY